MDSYVKIEMPEDEISELESMSQYLGSSKDDVVRSALVQLYDSLRTEQIDSEEAERLYQLYLNQYLNEDCAD